MARNKNTSSAVPAPEQGAMMRFATNPVPQDYSPFVELGATGLRQFGGYVREEWLRELQGRVGVRMYREMRDNDPIIGAMFFAIEMLLRSVKWTFEPVDKKSKDDEDAADFLEECISDTEQSWSELQSQFMTFLQFGWSVSEIVYKKRMGKSDDKRLNSKFDDGKVGWRKFAPRAQETLLRWEFDADGDPSGLVQLLPTGSPTLTVPLSKAVHLKTRMLKNNPEGVSILRNAYTSYYMGKRIAMTEAIGIERDLCGLPIGWVPADLLSPNATQAQKTQLAQIKKAITNTYRNEQEGHVWPLVYDEKGNKLYDITLLATGGRRAFTTNEVIDRYDQRKAATLLADFITLGSGTSAASGRGSTGQAKSKSDMFEKAVVGFLDIMRDEFNLRAVPDLLDLNAMKGRALLQHGDIARRDLQDLAMYCNNLATAGLITPDAQLEAHLREEGGLPIADLSESGNITQGAENSTAKPGNRPNDPAAANPKPQPQRKRRKA